MRARWLLLLIAPLTGCDCGAGGLGLVDAQLIVTPSTIDFGVVARGTSAARPVQLVNIGPGAVTVAALDVEGHAAITVEPLALPLVLAAGAEATLTVLYAPTESGAAQATVSLLADDREEPHLVEVRGSASAASMCVTPAFVPFARADGDGDQLVTIAACGDAPVTIERLDFEASGDTLTHVAERLPMALDPGERRTVRIHHAPYDTTRAAGALLTVHGTGTPASATVVITASPDIVPTAAGRYLYYWQVSTGDTGRERSDIMRLSLQADAQPEVFWGQSTGNGCPGCHHVSPDGRYVALIQRNAGLMLIDTNTRQQIVMPGAATRANGMSWRPEVTTRPPYQLVYSAEGRLFKASALEGDLGELPNTSTTSSASLGRVHVMPSWGSDGRIAYVVGVPTRARDWALTGGAEIMLIDQDGGTPVPLVPTSSTSTEASPGARPLARYYPAFSPDARWLAITESTLGTTYSSTDARVTLIRTDGSGERRELPGMNTVGMSRCYPAWSLDGRFLGFSASTMNAGRADWDIYYVPLDPETGLETGSPGLVPRANGSGFEHGVEWSR